LNSSTVDWPADFNNVEMRSLVECLEKNKQAFEELRKATEHPYYWNHYQKRSQANLSAVLMPNVMQSLSTYRRLARTMRWLIRYEAYNGNIDSALKDCIVLQKFGNHLQGKGLLIDQLVGVSIEALAFDGICMVLYKTEVSADTLKMLQKELSKQFKKQETIIDPDVEKVFWYDQIQRTFTDDGKGDGRVLMRGLPYAVADWKDILQVMRFSYPSRREVVAKIDGFFEQANEFFYRTPWDLRNDDTDKEKWNETLQQIGPMLSILEPTFRRVSQLAWRLETHRRGILTIATVMWYRKDRDHYPDNLNELISTGYLDSLPMDPFSGKPLVYKKTGDGFVLYSIGEDFKDDGGVMGRDRQGRPKMWADNGDWVFWPVPEFKQEHSADSE